ncbi:MAG: DUF4293 domain-containing protein [Crocinitomicaceae bacterium]|nr:DUF4293 domain-containing protein [Crocinitomicaceae bacterium]
MIQRIQTVYLAITIILLSIVTVGSTLFSFVNETARYTFSSYGITTYSLENDQVINTKTFPIFVGTIALALLCFLAVMSYKNLARQFKLGRTIFYLYFVMLVTVLVLSFYGDALIDTETTTRELGLGFYLLVAGFPFTFLSNTAIKRDKKLLESLDRLR